METIFILILTIAKHSTGVAMETIEFNSVKECKATGYLWQKKFEKMSFMNAGNSNYICVKKTKGKKI